MNPAIKQLKKYIVELEAINEFDSIEEQAENIGLIIQIKSSIKQLELCEKYGINGGSLVSVLPETGDPNICYLAVYENESSNSSNWEEVIFNGQQIQLSGGDLLIRK
ncbi:hypothetical protein V8073_004856 [Vibrio parahaemolyticus]